MAVHREPLGPAVGDPAAGQLGLPLGRGGTDGPDQRRRLGGLKAERTSDLLGSPAVTAELRDPLHEVLTWHGDSISHFPPSGPTHRQSRLSAEQDQDRSSRTDRADSPSLQRLGHDHDDEAPRSHGGVSAETPKPSHDGIDVSAETRPHPRRPVRRQPIWPADCPDASMITLPRDPRRSLTAQERFSTAGRDASRCMPRSPVPECRRQRPPRSSR